MGLDVPHQGSKQTRIAADQIARVHESIGFPRQIPYDATGLLNEDHASGDVPGLQPEFPIAVQPSAGDIGEIQRSRPGAPDASRLAAMVCSMP